MPRGKVAILVLIGVALAAMGGAWAVLWHSPKPAGPAKVEHPLHIDSKELDFGEAWETDRLEWPVTIENRGSGLQEFGLSGSCSCVSVEPAHGAIEPGEKRRFRLLFDLTPKPNDSGRDPLKEFETTLTANPKGAQSVSPPWVIRGRVRRVLGAVPRQLECVPISELAQATVPTMLDIVPVTPLRCLKVEVERAVASAVVEPMAGSAKVRIAISPRLPLAVGNQSTTMRLLPMSEHGEVLPPREIKLIVRGVRCSAGTASGTAGSD